MERGTRQSKGSSTFLRLHWRLAIYAILLMTAFNFLSHGTQDIYPTFLKVDHAFEPHMVSVILVIANIGAILGGLTLGTLSQRFGRRRVIIIGVLACLPVLPLWAFTDDPVLLTVGAFAMQFMVQGCWGLVPAHLNELSPSEARGTFPGVVYQLGNLLASINLWLQAVLAVSLGSYAYALAAVAVCAVFAVALLRQHRQRGKRRRPANRGEDASLTVKTAYPARTKTSTRSAGPLSSMPPIARTSMRLDGNPSSISN